MSRDLGEQVRVTGIAPELIEELREAARARGVPLRSAFAALIPSDPVLARVTVMAGMSASLCGTARWSTHLPPRYAESLASVAGELGINKERAGGFILRAYAGRIYDATANALKKGELR